jgi:hypothetical protein
MCSYYAENLEYGITDLSAQPDIPTTTQRETAQAIIDIIQSRQPSCKRTIGRDGVQQVVRIQPGLERYRFTFHRSFKLSTQQAKSVHSTLFGSMVYSFRCSQDQDRPTVVKNTPFERQKNRESMEVFSCGGIMNVYFPPQGQQTFRDGAQVVISITHRRHHQGRLLKGVPQVIREWIRDNPRPTSLLQREDLYRAIREGRIALDERKNCLTPALIHYWWQKTQAGVNRISDDPWENLEHMLLQDDTVHASFYRAKSRIAPSHFLLNQESI